MLSSEAADSALGSCLDSRQSAASAVYVFFSSCLSARWFVLSALLLCIEVLLLPRCIRTRPLTGVYHVVVLSIATRKYWKRFIISVPCSMLSCVCKRPPPPCAAGFPLRFNVLEVLRTG